MNELKSIPLRGCGGGKTGLRQKYQNASMRNSSFLSNSSAVGEAGRDNGFWQQHSPLFPYLWILLSIQLSIQNYRPVLSSGTCGNNDHIILSARLQRKRTTPNACFIYIFIYISCTKLHSEPQGFNNRNKY